MDLYTFIWFLRPSIQILFRKYILTRAQSKSHVKCYRKLFLWQKKNSLSLSRGVECNATSIFERASYKIDRIFMLLCFRMAHKSRNSAIKCHTKQTFEPRPKIYIFLRRFIYLATWQIDWLLSLCQQLSRNWRREYRTSEDLGTMCARKKRNERNMHMHRHTNTHRQKYAWRLCA